MLARQLARLGDKVSKFAHRTSMITNKTKLKLDIDNQAVSSSRPQTSLSYFIFKFIWTLHLL